MIHVWYIKVLRWRDQKVLPGKRSSTKLNGYTQETYDEGCYQAFVEMLKNPHKKDVLVCLRLIYNLYNHGKDLCFASSGFGSSAQSVCSIQSCIYLCIERKKKNIC